MKDTTDHIVDPSYDYTAQPWFEHGDERPSNFSPNPTFYDVCESRLSRRGVLAGGLGAAVTGLFSGTAALLGGTAARASTGSLLGFAPVTISKSDTITVPEGYTARVLVPWGTPITGDMPAFAGTNTGAEQGMQIGMHHDGMHFMPVEGSATEGYLILNHEYIEPRFLHGSYKGMMLETGDSVVYDAEGRRDDDEVLKEINAHGVSVVRVAAGADGSWAVVADPLNRRITGLTPMEIGGPVRGADLVKTKYSPDGTMTRGTLNNCANGWTPWGTYLTCEENWAGYFIHPAPAAAEGAEPVEIELPREQDRYGITTEQPGSRYGWHLARGGADEYIRFDLTPSGADATQDYRNEANGFGWVVEIDPSDAASVPVKRTHLGRFAHEGVVFAPAVSGQPVVAYAGDDSRFEYIYKFVSAAAYDPATTDGSILDEGTLYVARFNDDGTGEWLALAPNENGLTPEAGFADLADILVNTRLAADTAGATKMDRPEWGAVHPVTGEVYFTLTNNSRRIQTQVDLANPRAVNEWGHIIKWTEAGGDHAATSFDWDLFVIAGDEARSANLAGEPLDDTNIFACPDGLAFDPDGRLWIQTDIGEEAMLGALADFGNNVMLCADPTTGEIRRFLTGPIGQEITGWAATPDGRTAFVNVQHPGGTTSSEAFAANTFDSSWPDGNGAVPRSATVVITKDDGGVIGS